MIRFSVYKYISKRTEPIKIGENLTLSLFWILAAHPKTETDIDCYHWIEIGYDVNNLNEPMIIDCGNDLHKDCKQIKNTSISANPSSKEINLFDSMTYYCVKSLHNKIKKI